MPKVTEEELRTIKFNRFFFNPPFPKFWIYSWGYEAFIFHYEPDTRVCVARRGSINGMMEEYWIGIVHKYRRIDHYIEKTELAYIVQSVARRGSSLPVWQEPVVKKHFEDCPGHLFKQVMDHLNGRVGRTGLPTPM